MPVQQNIKLAVDAIVFGYSDNQLQVLLVQQKFGLLKGQWALVGGFVHDNEPLQTAVQRELKEEAGINVDYLEQLYTFGDQLDRDPRARVVSVAYFALVNTNQYKLIANSDAQDARWYPINALPPLAFDHDNIIAKAYQRLQSKLGYQPVGFNLLPELFLFSDLENLYCTILNKEIDRRNFRKKMLSFGILEETNFVKPRKSGRPGKLFKFNTLKYNQLEQEGFHFDIYFA
jgi:8-oxo-dGTP diphosphatase